MSVGRPEARQRAESDSLWKETALADEELSNPGDALRHTGQSATNTARRAPDETGGFFQRMVEQIKDSLSASSQDAAHAASDAAANLSTTSGNASNQAANTPLADRTAANDSAKSLGQGLH